jgi:hypothetical protein
MDRLTEKEQKALRACLQTEGAMSLRGAGGDEAISFLGKDCFAALAMTVLHWFADMLLEKPTANMRGM